MTDLTAEATPMGLLNDRVAAGEIITRAEGRKACRAEATLNDQLRSIEKQATAGFMHYAPTRIVVCPHCGGRMEAMDAKKHVRTA